MAIISNNYGSAFGRAPNAKINCFQQREDASQVNLRVH